MLIHGHSAHSLTVQTSARQVRWHEGFIIRYQTTTDDGRARRGAAERYQIAYPDGFCEWVDQLPHRGISFRKRGSDVLVSQWTSSRELCAPSRCDKVHTCVARLLLCVITVELAIWV